MLALQEFPGSALSEQSKHLMTVPVPSTNREQSARLGPAAQFGRARPALTTPDAFLPFWRETVAELEGTATCAETEPFAYNPYPELRGRKLRFRSLGDVPIAGYAVCWRDGRPRPLVVHAHGYGGRVAVQWLWARSGLNVVGFDVRGFGSSFRAIGDLSPWGFMLTGIDNPRRHALRGAVCDYIRAHQVGMELFGARTSRTIFQGFSFSGALALMAQAVTGSASLLATGVPTFGWHEGRLRLVRNGSGVEVRRYLGNRPDERKAVLRTLSYFDSMNFAPLIDCPTLAGYGRTDDVVPPETVLAILGHLTCRRETMSLPISHTDEPAEQLWDLFDAAWIELAVRGVPPGFGSGSPVHRLDYPTTA